MANTGGRNGTVTKAGTGASGSSATVSYPAIPASPGPPPVAAQEAHEDLYTGLSEPVYLTLAMAAMTEGAKVDCTVDASGNCTGATGHR